MSNGTLVRVAAFAALTAGAALVGGTAQAADLPRRAAPPLAPPPAFTWTGFYVGINAGYAFDAGEGRNGFIDNGVNPVAFPGGVRSAPFTVLPFPPVRTVLFNDGDRDGFTGGGQIGYNYQFTPGSGVVIGIEADAQYLDFGARRSSGITCSSACTLAPTFTPINGRLGGLDFFGTVRGRIGYAWGRLLVYGTGGFAYASGDDKIGGFSINNGGRGDDFRTGWTAGGGVEYALPTTSFLNVFNSSAVTVKVEGLYVSLDQRKGGLSLVGATTAYGGVLPVYDALGFNARREDAFAVVRAGLNYKFGTY